MRPRVFPAEDVIPAQLDVKGAWSFNEAAGIPRGRPSGVIAWNPGMRLASMRPRVFPAEDEKASGELVR